MAKETLKKEQVIEAIHKAGGKVTLAANLLKVSRLTVYNYAKKYKTVQKALDEATLSFSDSLVDEAEAKLRQLVRDGKWTAIRYVLSTKGKDRGYVERQEVTGKDGEAVEITIGWTDDAD